MFSYASVLTFVLNTKKNSLFKMVLLSTYNIIEPPCDFQQCGILASVDSDEPVRPPFKRRNNK